MARGQKTTREQIIKIFTVYAASHNINQTAKELKMSYNTVKGIIKKYENEDFVKKLLSKKSQEFSKRADGIVDSLLLLLERRVCRALEAEAELDRIISEIEKDGTLSEGAKKSAVKAINDIAIKRGVDITTMIGTLRDKSAVAKGELTENTKVVISLEE